VISAIVKLLRLASFVICLIVIVSFLLFALNRTGSASKHQTEAIATGPSTTSSKSNSTKHESGVRKAIDEASQKLTSPFAGVVSGSSSEWAIRGVKLLLALAVYGFGLSFIARAISIRI
jgi:hypothetical protein